MLIINLIRGIIYKKSPYRKVGISWIKEKIIKHRTKTGLKYLKVLNKKVFYNLDQEIVHCLKEIFFDQTYSFNTSKINPIIYDCGSHIGMSVLFYKTKYPNAVIKCFEPDSTNFNLLKKNIAEWKFIDVDIFQNPVWICDEEVSFEGTSSMSSKINLEINDQKNKNRIKAIRLSNLINEKIDFLKIDIEGAEYEVLKDCKEKLHFIDNLFIEFHSNFNQQYKLIEILKILDEKGFNFYLKEANNIYNVPFSKEKIETEFDLQLNIFAFRNQDNVKN